MELKGVETDEEALLQEIGLGQDRVHYYLIRKVVVLLEEVDGLLDFKH